MKKSLFSSVAILSLAAILSSCSDFDKISQDPYAIYDAPAEEYVHPIVFNTQKTSVSIFRSITCLIMQYGVNHNLENSAKIISNYKIPEGLVDDSWTAYYSQYGNAVKMYDRAVKQNSKGLQGVALILKAYLIMQITDTYGDVPFKDAGQLVLAEGVGKYTTAYDKQKDIYYSVISMLEDANTLLSEETSLSFNHVCDKTFNGNFNKWRRFGNSLYARVIMRVGMKVMAESAGLLEFEDDSRDFNITDRLVDLYQSYSSGEGKYPMMRGREDRPLVPFDKNNETEQTPFYGYTDGAWNSITACTSLCRVMLDGEEKIFERKLSDGSVLYPFGDNLLWQASEVRSADYSGHTPDPRYICWFRKLNGMPTQMNSSDTEYYYNNFRSKAGNFLGGSMVHGREDELDPVWLKYIFDLQNASSYALMQFSELPFIFAEAGARGWVASINDGSTINLLRKAVTESILEWNPYVTETSSDVISYVNWVMNEALFSGLPYGASNKLEVILTEKWISSFFIGIESWCDYRRTGYPLLKTNGSEAVGNDFILPTRMRYPSDEAYRNVDAFKSAINGWLGGSNNMQTDVWWADTKESKDNRLLGRQ